MITSDLVIEQLFPLVKREGYLITSPKAIEYNCIAWAAGRTDIWIWPTPEYFWPTDIPFNDKLSSFIKFYQSYGYSICKNDKLETGYEKIAIYVDLNTDNVTHAARQIYSGKWTSKLGRLEDIEHNTLDCLTESVYGEVAIIMKRKSY